MRAIIVDDEPLARDELKFLLAEHPQIEIVAEADNALEAVELINRLQPDLVFADIQMPRVSGLELAGMFSGQSHSPLWVFVTAYDQHALDAFERDAKDYLLKPVDPARLAQCIEKLSPNRPPAESTCTRISVQTGSTISFFEAEKIYFAHSDGTGVHIVGDQQGHTNISLKALEQNTSLIRCHRQYLINPVQIQKLQLKENGSAEAIIAEHLIPVSRRYLKPLKQALGITA